MPGPQGLNKTNPAARPISAPPFLKEWRVKQEAPAPMEFKRHLKLLWIAWERVSSDFGYQGGGFPCMSAPLISTC